MWFRYRRRDSGTRQVRKDTVVSREHRYALGTEKPSGQHYISIPVAGRLVDFEEYYVLEPIHYQHLRRHPAVALVVADQCRVRMHDHRLMDAPAADRGAADVIGGPVQIRWDQEDLAGRTALLLESADDDPYSQVDELPAGTTHVVIVDDTPNPLLELLVHPLRQQKPLVPISHIHLGLTGR